ncbi:tryptophan 7-halogenase [Psychrosphaera sp.]|nr:tryptophan 7-halogenase [Psychrosphaera sp.]
MSSENVVQRLVVVGGGTSGWLSAAYLAKFFELKGGEAPLITLIESSDVPTIGVGEATIPFIKETLQFLGISEWDFIKNTDATFKQSIKFIDWNLNSSQRHYHHNFSQPLHAEQFNYAKYWASNKDDIGIPYNYAATIQGQVCDNFLSPKLAEDKEFEGPLNYAYHLDAGKFATYLKNFSIKKNVKHVVDHITDVSLKDNGDVASVLLKTGKLVEGDLFIDCSGFIGLLIEKSLKSEFIPLDDVLFVDSAVTALVPHKGEELPSATHSTAQEAGWIWDIGLQSRRGTGYVYSSKYATSEEAEKTLAKYHDKDVSELKFRHLKMRTGYRKEQWKNNCVAIGLSAGFIEPLESTGIYLVEIALRTLTNLLPTKKNMKSFAAQYNALMLSQFEGAIDFIKLHYVLSDRTDTPFWTDNKLEQSIPNSLQMFLERIKTNVPTHFDLPVGPQCFTLYSYYAVIYGMELVPETVNNLNLNANAKAEGLHKEVNDVWNRAKQVLPTHKEIINRINQR